MRVLAIRGRNLASLPEFDVDFEAEPLANAGIFAITGPTGAGKSTLLDAMCLALFDSLPRLGAASKTKVETAQGDDLSGTDARAILRHGTGEGFAEIDFVGRDSIRYRARWQVQRARQKAEGKMQASRHSLHRLDTSEQIGSTKTETLAAIHERVGLSAEQFRRAVLLAQGDFEAFIRADENERAALLEKLTGSQIYTTLGKAAYLRANTLRAKQQGLEDRIAAQNGLDDEARATAEVARDAAQERAQAAALRLSGLEAAARWEKERTTLAERIAQCEADVARTEDAMKAAEPRREMLQRRRMAHGFAAEWTALGEARRVAETARADAAARNIALTEAADAIVSAEALDGEARGALAAEAALAEKLAPALERARMLDRQIGEAEIALSGLAGTRRERADRLDRSRTSESEAVSLLADIIETRDAHASWLAEHQALAPLASRETELAADCEEHGAVAARVDRLARDEAMTQAAQASAKQAFDAALQALDAAVAAHAATRATLGEAEARAPSPAARTALDERRDALTALDPLRLDARNKSERADEIAATLHRLREQQGIADDERTSLASRQSTIAEALPMLRHRLDEAKRAGALAEAASDEAAERLRAMLIDGEPCPVCGATDHALTAIDSLLGRQLDEQRARIATLEGEIAGQIREESATAAQIAALAQQAEQREAEIARQAGVLAAAGAARDTAHAVLAEKAAAAGLDVADPAFGSRLAEALAEAETERRDMNAALTALAQARTDESDARAAHESARSARDAAAERQRDVAEQRASIATSVAHTRDTLDRLGRALDAGFGSATDWRALTDPRAWLSTQTGQWRTRTAERAEALAAIPKLEQILADARTVSATTQALVEEVETQAAAHQSSRDAHTAQRATLLEGRPVAEIEAKRATALALLREGQAATQETLARAREAHASAAAHKQAADQTVARTQAEHGRRETDFHARIASQSLAEAEVAAAAAQGSAPLDTEEQALATLATEARDAVQALAQRRDDLVAHEAQDRPILSGDALIEATAQARAEADVAQAQFTESQFAIRRDDEVRNQTATLRADLERERESSRVWLALSGLIGDAEGRTFRRFAQGLTLDRLLGHANGRLAELKPRYALARGVGADMLIQVIDQDMGGEVRGVHNLSGGERFLISLALALGLAEMSTGRGLRIESLFIDEGFGALDTASLGQAIGVLEHLHASGRRVGVISHVEEVKERIPVKIEVTPVARGKSALSVVAG